MKKTILAAIILMASISIFAQDQFKGAWESREGDDIITLIIADDYLTSTRYSVKDKVFRGTHGGTIRSYSGGISGITEFNSVNKEEVGKEYKIDVSLQGNKMTASSEGRTMIFTRLDDGTKNMAGNWRITQRAQDGKLQPIHTSGPRKTIKILSSTRFQWAAINTETGEFSGTGGGTYTFENGIYTENIEFFSRDSSRVGMSLSFNGKIDGKDWYHSGKSSRGDPINEVWSRR
jgi:hypothetical protein